MTIVSSDEITEQEKHKTNRNKKLYKPFYWGMIIRNSRDIMTKVYFRETAAPVWLCRNKYDASLAKAVRRLPWRNKNNPWTFFRSSHQMSLSVKTREDVDNTSGTKRIKVLEISRLKACTRKRAGGISSQAIDYM